MIAIPRLIEAELLVKVVLLDPHACFAEMACDNCLDAGFVAEDGRFPDQFGDCGDQFVGSLVDFGDQASSGCIGC